jgi:hypothetical protein
MNTTTKITFGLFAVLSLGVLGGCQAPLSSEEMVEDTAELDSEETIGEAEQAIMTGPEEVTPPVLNQNTPYRIRIQVTGKCLDLPSPVLVLGEPLVQRTCNQQPLDNSNNTQAFRFVQVQGNLYLMKPYHQTDTDLCIYSSGPSMDNGGNAIVGNCNGNPQTARQLELRAYTDSTQTSPWDSFVTLSFEHSSRCLTLAGSFPGDFAAIVQYGTTGTTYCEGLYYNQRLRIEQ